MTGNDVARNRLRMLPPIRRARLWRLYAENRAGGLPSRFLDFWMDGGRSILGAKGTGIGTAAKAATDMGLTRPFPSVVEARLEKALLAAYPGYCAARFYGDEGRALAAAATVSPNAKARLIAPFGEYLEGDAGVEQGIAMPILPCPAAFSPGVLLFENLADAEAAGRDLVPPLSLGCAHRALCEFERFRLTYNESLWKKVDRRLGVRFERRGPYLYPRCGEGAYEAFFTAALSAGVLLSPRRESPSIIPGDFDDGEIAALATALAAVPGESA